MKVLLTGGLGGVGAYVTRRFLAAGHAARVLELDSPLSRKTLSRFPRNSAPEIFWGDVTRLEDVEEALEGTNLVVHLAGIIPPRADEVPDLTWKVNVEGTRTVLEALRRAGRRIPLVHTSSIAVFGDTRASRGQLHPERDPLNPHSPYERSKAEAEKLVKESGLPFVALRLAAILPFDLSPSRMKGMFIMPWDTRIEFCHVEDTATAFLRAAERFENIQGRVFIVGGGPKEQLQYYDMISRILGRMGLPAPEKEKFSKGPSHLDWYDTADSQAALEFQGRTFEQYLDELYRPFPRPLQWIMQKLIGPLLGRWIVKGLLR